MIKDIVYKLHKFLILSKRIKIFYFIIFLTLISSFLEILSIASFIPFISSVFSQNFFLHNYLLRFSIFSNFFDHYAHVKFLLIYFYISFFILVILLNAIFKFFLLWYNQNFIKNLGNEISGLVIKKILNQNYNYLINENSSEIIANLIIKIDDTIIFINQFIIFIISLIIGMAIIFSLFLVNSQLTLIMLVFFSTTFLLISAFSKNEINKISKLISSISGNRIKSIQEIIGYLRQILLGNSSGFFIDGFKKQDFFFRQSNLKISIYALLPKIFIETLGIILVCIVIVISITYLSYEENNLIISLSVIGYGFQKLLFIFNQLYMSWMTCASIKHRAYDVVCLLELNEKREFQHHEIVTIGDKIQFSNVDFKYNNSPYIFKKINLTIKKNSIIGIIGSSGSGKTTLLDLFCGLLSPTKGKILIDNKNIIDFLETWKKNIAYVPQNVFLTDKSIKENIAFTDDKNNIKFDKVILASKQSLCFDFINKLPKKFNTLIGKNGIRLSGGQAQRIAFARAIYADFDVLLLDEVTSALDSNNEKKILHFLKNQLNNKTILMASHKMSCLRICDSIILIKNKNLFYYPSLKKYLSSKN